MTEAIHTMALLCLVVASAEFLVERTLLKHFGTGLLVIALGALAANTGAFPRPSLQDPVIDSVFSVVAPLAIFLILLDANIRAIGRAGLRMIALFLLGSAGTVVGVMATLFLLGAPVFIGPSFAALGGMLTGTYIGGSVNFNAIGLHYGVVRDGTLFGGTVAADNIVTALWMIVNLTLPRVMGAQGSGDTEAVDIGSAEDPGEVETASIRDLCLAVGLGGLALVVSLYLEGLTSSLNLKVPSVLIVTTLALILAQLGVIRRLRGRKVAGYLATYLFLAAIGASCDVHALARVGTTGLWLLLLTTAIVATHGAILFGVALLLRLDLAAAVVASQANIGGAASALALARSLKRPDLTLPGVLVGTLGYAIGTYAGFVVAEILQGWA